MTVAALVPKQRPLTLSVVAVGEGRGDQRTLQGATTHSSVTPVKHNQSSENAFRWHLASIRKANRALTVVVPASVAT